MNPQLAWYVARATGIVGWTLLAASVVLGLALSTRTRPGGVRPNWLLDLHRHLGGLATIFTAVHVSAIVADTYVHFGPADVLVPFASSWRPAAVAWGVASMYLLAAVELTSLARRRLPPRLWRAVHVSAFPLFATSTVHALTAGTDASSRPFTALVGAVTAAVVLLTTKRVVQRASAGRRPARHDATHVARGRGGGVPGEPLVAGR